MDSSEREFLLAKYEADRAHELELERATVNYETAALQALFFLNGGSATAFLALLGSGAKDAFASSSGWMIAALVAWVLGLLLSIITGAVAHQAQKGYAGAHRASRQAMGLQLLGRGDPVLLGKLPEHSTPATVADLAASRQRHADRLWTIATFLVLGPVLCFIVGLFAALRTVIG